MALSKIWDFGSWQNKFCKENGFSTKDSPPSRKKPKKTDVHPKSAREEIRCRSRKMERTTDVPVEAAVKRQFANFLGAPAVQAGNNAREKGCRAGNARASGPCKRNPTSQLPQQIKQRACAGMTRASPLEQVPGRLVPKRCCTRRKSLEPQCPARCIAPMRAPVDLDRLAPPKAHRATQALMLDIAEARTSRNKAKQTHA